MEASKVVQHFFASPIPELVQSFFSVKDIRKILPNLPRPHDPHGIYIYHLATRKGPGYPQCCLQSLTSLTVWHSKHCRRSPCPSSDNQRPRSETVCQEHLKRSEKIWKAEEHISKHWNSVFLTVTLGLYIICMGMSRRESHQHGGKRWQQEHSVWKNAFKLLFTMTEMYFYDL